MKVTWVHLYYCKTVSNSIGIRLPKPKMCRTRKKSALQQSRQRKHPFCIEGEKQPKVASPLRRDPNIWREARG